MLQLVELTGILVDTLRKKIPSPHTSGNWIYSDYPRQDATFPRISVTQTSGSVSQIGIGEWTDGQKGQLYTVDYDIDVWVKTDDRATIDSEVYVGTKLRDKYTDLIVAALEEEKPTLKDENGIIDIETLNITSIPLDEENMLHRKTISIRVTFVWLM